MNFPTYLLCFQQLQIEHIQLTKKYLCYLLVGKASWHIRIAFWQEKITISSIVVHSRNFFGGNSGTLVCDPEAGEWLGQHSWR